MYGIPPGTDLDVPDRIEALQVCSGENEVILNLHPDISMMIATDVRILFEGPATLEDAKSIGASLLPFLGCSIADAEGSPDGTLRLTWSDGKAFGILDTSAVYASYTISHGTETLVV